MKKIVITLACLLPISYVSPASANEAYVQFAYGQAKLNSDAVSDQEAIYVDNFTLEDNVGGIQLGLGFVSEKGIGMQFAFSKPGDYTLDIPQGARITSGGSSVTATAPIRASYDVQSIGIAGTYTQEFSDNFALMFKVGMHQWDATTTISGGGASISESDDGTDPFYGLSAEYRMNEKFGFYVGYDKFEGDEEDITFTHLGARFYFPPR